VSLANCFIHGWVCVNESCNILWVGFPVHNQLSFTDLLAYARADHVNTKNWTIILSNQLDKSGCAKNLGFSVST